MNDDRTQSIWTSSFTPPQLPTFRGHIHVDVAIVGAGITGLTTAALLKRAGKTVAVIERGEFGSHGTTHRTSAHLTSRLDQEYSSLIRKFDEDAARTAVHANQAAIDLIEQLATDLQFDNEFCRIDGYQYTEVADEVSEIEDDFYAAQRLGVNCELVDSVPLNLPAKRAFRVRNQAQFHPLKHLAGLAQYVNGGGSHGFHQSPVRDYEEGNPCHLTISGGTVTAKDIVLATHTPMGVWATVQTRLVPYLSYCIAARVDGPALDALLWDNADPYHYIRSFETSDGNTLIIGGADTKTGHSDDTRSAFEKLESYARDRFNVSQITHRWSAQFFEPADGMPYIGRGPGSKNVYIATGYSGTGLTYGTAAAMLISDLIIGRENLWAQIFSPSRLKPVASAKRVMEEVGSTIQGLIGDRFLTVAARDVDDLPTGDGRLITSKGKRLAVYRDHDRTLHAHSAVCTHLGCMLDWNSAEKQWDCKCHGSVFDPKTGEPVDGPATMPLKQHSIESHSLVDDTAIEDAPATSRRHDE